MLSSKQQEYLQNCNHRWNIKVGATRSGKTWLDYAVVIPKRLMAMRGQGQALILGNTQGTADRNVLDPMREIWGDRLVSSIRGGTNSATIFGKKVYVMGADNKKHIDRIRGMTIEYAYGDEMPTWSQGVFEMLKSRLSCEHSIFDGTGNPDAPSNYVKQFIESNADIYCQHSTIFDNPFLTQEFVDNLCKEYEGTVYYKRYILGEWALAEGLIYPMYEDAIIADLPNEFTQYALSLDYGTQNAFAGILWGLCEGVWYAIDLYYYSGRDTGIQKTDNEYADDIDKFTEQLFAKGLITGKLEVIIDPSAASFIALLQKRGRYKVRPADNAVADGIRETATAMRRGKIKVHNRLKPMIDEFQGYVWDDNEKEDKPVKVNDHCMDALRYFVKTKRIVKERAAYTPMYGAW